MSRLWKSSKIFLSCRPIFPDLKITNGPPKPLYPTSKRNLVPILKSDTSKNKENKKKTITSNWEISNREPKSPNSQNLNNFAFDDDLLRINRSPGNSSPKFASSHHGLCTNPVRPFQYLYNSCVTPVYTSLPESWCNGNSYIILICQTITKELRNPKCRVVL